MDIIRPNIKYTYIKELDTWKVEQLLPRFLGVFVIAGDLGQSKLKTLQKYDALIKEVYLPMALRADYVAPEKVYTVQFDHVEIRVSECQSVAGRSFVELWGTRKPFPMEMKTLRAELVKEQVKAFGETNDWTSYDNWNGRPAPIFA